jgi:hypothetical protein
LPGGRLTKSVVISPRDVGARRGTAASTPESRVIEVTRDTGAVVWELRFPKDYGVYRAERLSPPPLLKKIAQ